MQWENEKKLNFWNGVSALKMRVANLRFWAENKGTRKKTIKSASSRLMGHEFFKNQSKRGL